jgi:hypothetical protein
MTARIRLENSQVRGEVCLDRATSL